MNGDPTRPEPLLVANYNDRSGHIAFYLFAWCLFSAPFFALWKSEAARNWLVSLDPRIATADWRPILGFFALMAALITVDLVLVLIAVFSGRPALVIDKDGVAGFTGGFWRRIAWNEVDFIERKPGYISVVSKPRNPVQRFFLGLHRNRKLARDRYKWEYAVRTPVNRVDRSDTEILAAIASNRPDLFANHQS